MSYGAVKVESGISGTMHFLHGLRVTLDIQFGNFFFFGLGFMLASLGTLSKTFIGSPKALSYISVANPRALSGISIDRTWPLSRDFTTGGLIAYEIPQGFLSLSLSFGIP